MHLGESQYTCDTWAQNRLELNVMRCGREYAHIRSGVTPGTKMGRHVDNELTVSQSSPGTHGRRTAWT